jgi:hypothetical protein
MTNKLIAQTLVETHASSDGQRLEVAVADAGGRTQSISLSKELAACLARVLQDFAIGAATTGAVPTKLPKQFAVGKARYEDVVLIRFEDESPYGLRVADAIELGRALLEESKFVAAHPAITTVQ